MIIFFLVALTYAGLLLLIKPAPESLKCPSLSFEENFKLVWASLFIGLFVLSIYQLTTKFTFIDVDEGMYYLFALNNKRELAYLWPVQFITHSFIHVNILHIIGNLSGLGLASIYERRVGAKRYFTVLFISCLASTPSIFFYTKAIAVSGISGGVFGLFAAYFTDRNDLSLKDWAIAIVLFVFIAVLVTIDGLSKTGSEIIPDFQIDYIGHILGAIGAIIFCRLCPIRKKANA